jgi:hypothetical protein
MAIVPYEWQLYLVSGRCIDLLSQAVFPCNRVDIGQPKSRTCATGQKESRLIVSNLPVGVADTTYVDPDAQLVALVALLLRNGG